MIKRAKVTILTEAKAAYKLNCAECNWEQIILSGINAEIKSCPWCGWNDFENGTVEKTGVYQTINCAKHGNIIVIIQSEDIRPEDFMDNLVCPHCE